MNEWWTITGPEFCLIDQVLGTGIYYLGGKGPDAKYGGNLPADDIAVKRLIDHGLASRRSDGMILFNYPECHVAHASILGSAERGLLRRLVERLVAAADAVGKMVDPDGINGELGISDICFAPYASLIKMGLISKHPEFKKLSGVKYSITVSDEARSLVAIMPTQNSTEVSKTISTPASSDHKPKDKDEAERDRLWHRTFDAIYDTLYNEIEMSTYIRRLELISIAAAIAVAVTATGGIGGLIAKATVWKTENGTWLWAGLLILSAIILGVRQAIDPVRKIPVVQHLVSDLASLKNELEEFRSVMESDPLFSISAGSKKYAALTKRCTELTQRCPTSVLLHLKVRKACQEETNLRLRHML